MRRFHISETLHGRIHILIDTENAVQPRQFKDTANLFLQRHHFHIPFSFIYRAKEDTRLPKPELSIKSTPPI